VREREVFQLITCGTRIVDAARELCISRKTVETHVYRLYRKLGCHNVGDLVRFAAEHGLLRSVPDNDIPLTDPALDEPTRIMSPRNDAA